MTIQTFYTRQMLMQYGRQLVAARRLARYEQVLGRGPQADIQTVAAKRRAMVERIAHEIMENLIFSGSNNPIVLEVKERLALELGEELIFRYPPADRDFKIFRVTSQGEIEVTGTDKQKVMGRLWDVTLRTVDATML